MGAGGVYWYYLQPPYAHQATSTSSLQTSVAASVTGVPLSDADFNLTRNAGCVLTDPSTGVTNVFFTVYIRNRENLSLHFEDAAISGHAIYTNLTIRPFGPVLAEGTPTYSTTVQFTLHFPASGKGYVKGQVLHVFVLVTFFVEGYNKPLQLWTIIPISTTYPQCAST